MLRMMHAMHSSSVVAKQFDWVLIVAVVVIIIFQAFVICCLFLLKLHTVLPIPLERMDMQTF